MNRPAECAWRVGVNRASCVIRWSLGAVLLWACSDRSAWAYVDPGTGAQVFGSVWPMLAVIGVAVLATLGFARSYVTGIARAIWRNRLWSIPLMVLACAVAAWCVLAG